MDNSNKEMVYAPMIMPTLCRDKHFIRAIESLKVNTWAKFTTVYVAVDYPKSEKHWDGYKKICKYLEEGDFSAFKEFIIIKREFNYGASKNTASLRDNIISRFDRWIYAEDDIEFAPVFLEYMDKCLNLYETDPVVVAVNGYAYPVNWRSNNYMSVILQSSTFSAWGTGYWRDKYLLMANSINNGLLKTSFDAALRDGRIRQMIKGRKYDYLFYILAGGNERRMSSTCDMSYGVYLTLNHKYVVTPVLSKTRNHGFDGSGLTCRNVINSTNLNSLSYDYENQPIDESLTFEVIPDESDECIKKNHILLDDFLAVPKKEKIVSDILLPIYRIFGPKKYVNIYKLLKKLKD